MPQQRNVAAIFRMAHFAAVLPDHETFKSTMAVRLRDRSRVREAALFARSHRMAGRTFGPLDDVRWEFENIEDGVLFRLMFDGSAEPPMDILKYLSFGDK